MNIREYSKIAILQTAFIGDVILTIPLVDTIRRNNPDCEITFITTPQAAEIADIASSVNNTLVFDKRSKQKSLSGIRSFARDLNSNNFDLWISPHRSFRSSLLSYLIKADYKIGFKNAAFSWLYDYRAKYIPNFHEIERNFELLNPFEIDNYSNLNECLFSISETDKKSAKEITYDLNEYIVLSPGSVWETKKWLPEYFAVLAEMLKNSGFGVVLSGSNADYDICDFVSKQSGARNLSGLTNIPTTLEIVRNAKLVITNDSAPTHFAGFMNTPVITIYGPTSPIFGFSPRADKSRIIYNDKLKCSPCRIHGSRKCPIGTHDCMKSIKPDFVFSEFLSFID
ncbi:MAG: glycosyltransferase family 9 protein [Candidatus Kapabacteria bacterium]|nr:glycosyltransferase family 9 protein [Ignavibacteriota bacterium]MCW5883910.1 glycosyltransferase family 9 protein [Candidatus Kapabacteria bacterium]